MYDETARQRIGSVIVCRSFKSSAMSYGSACRRDMRKRSQPGQTSGSLLRGRVGTTVWVYSPAGALLDTRTLATTANLGGTGQRFWTFDASSLNVYKVGASATPTAVYAVAPNTIQTFLAASGQVLTMWDTAVPEWCHSRQDRLSDDATVAE